MVDVRTLLAAVLGVGLGLVLVAAPDAVIRVQTAGRLPSDRGGTYGRDGGVPDRWRLFVRGIGMVLILGGLYFGWTVL
jgi:hypothetical protein